MDPQECHDACIAGGYAWCRWMPYTSCDGGVCGGDFARVFICRTVNAELSCVPAMGTVPFSTLMTVTLENTYDGQRRRIAGRVDVTLAGGTWFPYWRTGYTNVSAGSAFTSAWVTSIPALGSVIGDNTFTLVAEDVTPSPYNQLPYPPSGDTDTSGCTVTGIAP